MLSQITVENDRIIKEIKIYDSIETERDIRTLENELKGHETFSEIILDITDAGKESAVLKRWRQELKKKNDPLCAKLSVRDSKSREPQNEGAALKTP